MSPKLPQVTGEEVVRALHRAGFVFVRGSGSHRRYVHHLDQSRAATVIVHGSRALKKGTLHSILVQAGLSLEDFLDLL